MGMKNGRMAYSAGATDPRLWSGQTPPFQRRKKLASFRRRKLSQVTFFFRSYSFVVSLHLFLQKSKILSLVREMMSDWNVVGAKKLHPGEKEEREKDTV